MINPPWATPEITEHKAWACYLTWCKKLPLIPTELSWIAYRNGWDAAQPAVYSKTTLEERLILAGVSSPAEARQVIAVGLVRVNGTAMLDRWFEVTERDHVTLAGLVVELPVD